MPANRRSSAARSYTLLELIMVMAVLALAAALLIPNMTQRDSLTVQAAVRLIIADLSFAQSDALANQEYRRVYFYPGGTGYCVIRVTDADFFAAFDAATADYIYDPLGVLGRYIVDFSVDGRFEGVVIEDTTTIDLEPLTPDGAWVTYDALGGTVKGPNDPGIGGQIIVTYDNERYQIDMSPFTGKLTVTKL